MISGSEPAALLSPWPIMWWADWQSSWMSTHGFGRLDVVGIPLVEDYSVVRNDHSLKLWRLVSGPFMRSIQIWAEPLDP